jgi:anti-sigma-K factor RskA
MDKKIEELFPFYALGALTSEERELVEAYLREHPEARMELDGLESAAAELPYGATPITPPDRVKESLMSRVHADVEASERASKQRQVERPRERRWADLFPAFSMGVAVVAVVWATVLNIQLARLQNQVLLLSEALVAQANSIEQINANLPQASPATTVSLKGTEAQPEARGQLIVDQHSQSAVLVIAGLPQLEAGKTYQVWLIDSGGPKSAGLLTVDANGQGLLIVTAEIAIGEFNALGVSIEPEGGSDQPTGEIVVLSDL